MLDSYSVRQVAVCDGFGLVFFVFCFFFLYMLSGGVNTHGLGKISAIVRTVNVCESLGK